jgi:hypothetical protein
MNTKKILLATLLGCLFVSARADDAAGQLAGLNSAIAGAGSDAGPASSGLIVDPLRGKLVKNAPYSAEAIQENLRNLADGNQITTRTSTLNYRDSQGNTRQETRAPSGEVQSINITTAADNVNYSLVPMIKLVFKLSLDKIEAKAAAIGAAAGKAYTLEAQRKQGKPATAEHKDGAEIVVKRAAPNANINPNMVPLLVSALGDAKWSSKAATKDLGVKDIEGVKAEGKLRSYEIPAGEVGNRNPIVVTNESWFSPELQVTLYSKHSDARSGDVVYRLANLKRGEQAAALFSVPSDYTVKDITEGSLQGW